MIPKNHLSDDTLNNQSMTTRVESIEKIREPLPLFTRTRQLTRDDKHAM